MLTRKCEEKVGDFLKEGDFNVRVTVITKGSSRFLQKSVKDGAWREAFRDSIGGGIIHDANSLYSVECITEDVTNSFEVYGNLMIDEIWKYAKDQDIVRINLFKVNNSKFNVRNSKTVHSWIIIRK